MTERRLPEMLRSAVALGLVAVIGTALLSSVHGLTRDRIEAEERRVVRERLGQILPVGRFDNSPQDDVYQFTDATYFPGGQTVTAYRARQGEDPVAVVLRFRAIDGYNGDIQLLAGIDSNGTLTGVRVISHQETPGLGDAIETEKSDWVLGFVGKSLANPGVNAWTVRRDGGEFDQFTGATVTPRAVVLAVRDALQYFSRHRAELFSPPAKSEDS